MNTKFFNKEEIKKIISQNRQILKDRKEINFKKNFKKDSFDELHSNTLDNYILNFTKKASVFKEILDSEEELKADYLKEFYSLEIRKKETEDNKKKKLLEYYYSSTTASILILVGTFGDNFGFSNFFYNNLISKELVNSCEVALRNIDLFIFEAKYDDTVTSILSYKEIGEQKKTIKSILKKFLEGIKDPQSEIYDIAIIELKSKLLALFEGKQHYPRRLLYAILQVYLGKAVRNTNTLIDTHVLEKDVEELKKKFDEENIRSDYLESDLKNVSLMSSLDNF